MKKLLAIWMVILIFTLMSDTAFPQAQYLIDGINPFALTLETLPPHNCQTVTITLDPGGEIDIPIFSYGGCWITWDTSQVAIVNVLAADSYGDGPQGPWDPGYTGLVSEPVGPGTYMITLGMFATIPINQGPIPLCDIEFCCEGLGQSQITISAIPEWDTWISGLETGYIVWDPYIDQGIINLTQVIPQTDSDDDGILDYEDNCLFEHNTNQVDTYPPGGNGIGEACECEGNFDADQDVDGTDAARFKSDFGRSTFRDPCPVP